MPFNEKADCLAKSVADSDTMLDWIFPKDITRAHKQNKKRQCEQAYRSSKYILSHGDIIRINKTHLWALYSICDNTLTSLFQCKILISSEVLARYNFVKTVDGEIAVFLTPWRIYYSR